MTFAALPVGIHITEAKKGHKILESNKQLNNQLWNLGAAE